MSEPPRFSIIPKRRRPSFKLRTLMAAVTFLCCFLGWYLHTVNQQLAMRHWIEERGGEVRSSNRGIKSFHSRDGKFFMWVIDGPVKPILSYGDWRRTIRVGNYVAEIDVPPSASEEDKARIQGIFPGANLYREKATEVYP